MASVRRSLFTSEGERLAFLNRLVNGSREILQTKQGLAEHDNYHEFCRLLGRLKTNYQLSELVGGPALGGWWWAGGCICRHPPWLPVFGQESFTASCFFISVSDCRTAGSTCCMQQIACQPPCFTAL